MKTVTTLTEAADVILKNKMLFSQFKDYRLTSNELEQLVEDIRTLPEPLIESEVQPEPVKVIEVAKPKPKLEKQSEDAFQDADEFLADFGYTPVKESYKLEPSNDFI